MEFSILGALQLIGALGFFIYGMKIMSEGIQKIAGNKMRQFLGAMTSNRFAGIFTGFTTTALIQSSSATTVMIVSFVNAGLLTLRQSIGVIMGANIGTTITAWIITILGFKIKMDVLALPIIAFGLPLMFSSNNKYKALSEFLIGFALLFLGLDALKGAVPDISNNPEILHFLEKWTSMGILSTLLFVGIGTIVTVVVQSSSAAMALTLVLCADGIIPFEAAAAMVLGENIGTTITANLAAMVGNIHAKRTARAHLIFNLFGVIWMVVAFNGVTAGIDKYMVASGAQSPFVTAAAIPAALSIFHTVFNIANAVFLIGLVDFIARTVTKMVPSKGDDEEFRLEYIDTGIMLTPELSIMEAKKEVAKFGKITVRMSGFIRTLLLESDSKKKKKLNEKIKKYEEITDQMEIEISTYLAKVSENEMTTLTSQRLRGMLSIVNDLERIGDIFYQMSKSLERKEEEKIWFTPEQRNNVIKILSKVDEAFEIMLKNLESDYGTEPMESAVEKEKEINELRNELRIAHLKDMQNKNYSFKGGMVYNDIFSSCEKIGDHIVNVSEGVAGEI